MRWTTKLLWLASLLVSTLWTSPAQAAEITFTDIADQDDSGLSYERQPSSTLAIFNSLTELEVFAFADLPISPSKPHGAPGVALFDFDQDGDLDLYVTNGPGAANSLFQNQIVEIGETRFVDVAVAAGVAATEQDSSGVCASDIDNDGDADLLVLSFFGASRLFENQGDGTFVDISSESQIGGENNSSVSCSFGDFDNDGLLDVVIANGLIDSSNTFGIVIPFDFVQHNQVLRNLGGNQFEDVSAEVGIEATSGFDSPLFDGSPTLTWAVAAVDYDQDGDVDIVHADDQGGVPFPRDGGVIYGAIHVFENDGTGHFTDQTGSKTPSSPGSWMGLSFGDINGDGLLDLFGSNLGDYASTTLTTLDPVYGDFAIYLQGDLASRWYVGGPDGALSDPGLGSLAASPFGWGTSMSDYDNDRDTDIFMHGGLYFGPVGQGAPGAIFNNDGTGQMSRDVVALADSTDHEERTVQGMAMGDLDGNGFEDVVSVSNFDIREENQVLYNHSWGSPFDGGRYAQIFLPTGDLTGDSFFGGQFPEAGSLSVELSSGNDNGWVKVRTLGSTGLTSKGVVNRDGVGAVVQFTAGDRLVVRPVIAGASYASQDSLEATFGLGQEASGTVDVLWPGGVRNRLYSVPNHSRVLFPEIPCSFDAAWTDVSEYGGCVRQALGELEELGAISVPQARRFFASALRAFFDER